MKEQLVFIYSSFSFLILVQNVTILSISSLNEVGYMYNRGQRVDAVQVNLTPLISGDALATDASGRIHLASSLARPPPMPEIRGSRPASEQPRETCYICLVLGKITFKSNALQYCVTP